MSDFTSESFLGEKEPDAGLYAGLFTPGEQARMLADIERVSLAAAGPRFCPAGAE